MRAEHGARPTGARAVRRQNPLDRVAQLGQIAKARRPAAHDVLEAAGEPGALFRRVDPNHERSLFR